jgi:hypothetical protein
MLVFIGVFGMCVFDARGQNLCGQVVVPDGAAIRLASPAFESLPVILELAESYGSAANLGTPNVLVDGQQISVQQANVVGWSAPTYTCRIYHLNAGPLAPGNYQVTWTTIEELAPPLAPPTRTRVRTFSFEVLSAEAIPTFSNLVLLLFATTLAMIAVAFGLPRIYG